MSSPAPDVVLIGGGIMSAHLGAMLKCLDPRLAIEVYETASEPARESSDGWNNAGTGHAGLCELNYTPRIRLHLSVASLPLHPMPPSAMRTATIPPDQSLPGAARDATSTAAISTGT